MAGWGDQQLTSVGDVLTVARQSIPCRVNYVVDAVNLGTSVSLTTDAGHRVFVHMFCIPPDQEDDQDVPSDALDTFHASVRDMALLHPGLNAAVLISPQRRIPFTVRPVRSEMFHVAGSLHIPVVRMISPTLSTLDAVLSTLNVGMHNREAIGDADATGKEKALSSWLLDEESWLLETMTHSLDALKDQVHKRLRRCVQFRHQHQRTHGSLTASAPHTGARQSGILADEVKSIMENSLANKGEDASIDRLCLSDFSVAQRRKIKDFGGLECARALVQLGA